MSPIKMLIFSSTSCPTCKHLENNVLPAFVKVNPDLVIEKHMIAVNDGDITTPEAEALADAYDVQAAPTIIMVGEVARGMGEVCSAPALKRFVQDALKKGRAK
jgi:thioredoxin-related protein